MPSKKFGMIWKAEPHTLAKIKILETYLQTWFQIMGRSMPGADIFYIDGFAGPGEYVNSPKGSPVAAIDATKTALALSGGQWKAGDIHCIFIESDRKSVQPSPASVCDNRDTQKDKDSHDSQILQ